MRKWLFFAIIILIFGTEGAKGEEKGKVENEISLPSEAGGWKWDGKEMNYNSRTIFDYMDGAAELYLAYRFQSLAVRRFEQPGQPPLMVEAFEMGSPEDAYGVFSIERQDEDAGIGQGSEFGGGLLRFWKGKYFVSIYGEGESSEAQPVILRLGRELASSIKMSGPTPGLIHYLPDGFVAKSVRYLRNHVLLNQRFFIAHKNIFNLNRETEAVLAQYLQDKQKTHLLLIHYPTAKQAEGALQSFKKAYMPEALAQGRLETEDRKWTIAKRQKEFILVVFGAPALADADELIKGAEGKLREKGP